MLPTTHDDDTLSQRCSRARGGRGVGRGVKPLRRRPRLGPRSGHAPTQAPTNPPQPPAANHHAAADHLDHRARSPAPFRKHSFDMGLPLHTSNGAGSPAANGATDAAPSYYAPAA